MAGIIISIANHKGGTGKTTTAVNLGHALASKCKKRVLVVDNDAQCNTTTKLIGDLKPTHSMYELLNPEGEEFSPEDFIYETTYNENLLCIPNVQATSVLEPAMIRQSPQSFNILRRRLREYVLKNFDIVLIDNPPNLGTFVICSLHASDFVIIPHQAGSSDSVDGLMSALKFIYSIREDGNQDLKFLRVLVTQVDRRLTINKAIISQIRKVLKEDQVFKTTIPGNTVFQHAELYKQTIFRFRPSAPGAAAYKDLAFELVDILARIKEGTNGSKS